VLESLLGHMQSPISRAELGQLIANRAHGELSGQQTEDAAVAVSSDLSIFLSMMWMKRKQEPEKGLEATYEERMKTYKECVHEMKEERADNEKGSNPEATIPRTLR